MHSSLPLLFLVLLSAPCALLAQSTDQTGPSVPDVPVAIMATAASTVTNAPASTNAAAVTVDSSKVLQVGIAERPPYLSLIHISEPTRPY